MYNLECSCIDKKTGKPFVIKTVDIEGICPNCGLGYIIQWNRLNRVRSLKERFYALFGV